MLVLPVCVSPAGQTRVVGICVSTCALLCGSIFSPRHRGIADTCSIPLEYLTLLSSTGPVPSLPPGGQAKRPCVRCNVYIESVFGSRVHENVNQRKPQERESAQDASLRENGMLTTAKRGGPPKRSCDTTPTSSRFGPKKRVFRGKRTAGQRICGGRWERQIFHHNVSHAAENLCIEYQSHKSISYLGNVRIVALHAVCTVLYAQQTKRCKAY